jgi:hypothetical protein
MSRNPRVRDDVVNMQHVHVAMNSSTDDIKKRKTPK